MTVEPTNIDYEALALEAMRGLVRNVLTQTAKTGLPGDHHFYISFETTAPGVSLSRRLSEKYPHEMTIVLQHRFWDLQVSDGEFEVKLTFDGIPERLVVPFNAIKVFFDPSVRYGLQFEDSEAAPLANASVDLGDTGHVSRQETTPSGQNGRSRTSGSPRRSRSLKSATLGDQDTTAAADNGSGQSAVAERSKKAKPPNDAPGSRRRSLDHDQAANSPGSAQIVDLDAFRKK